MSWLRSSQVRIAVVSVLTSAIGLLAFGGLAWWWLRASTVASLDRELLSLGEQTAFAAHWELDASRLEAALRTRFGEERSKGWIFAVQQTGRPLSRSERWPVTLDPKTLRHSDKVVTFDRPDGMFGDLMGPPGGHHGPPPKPPSDFDLFFPDPLQRDQPGPDGFDGDRHGHDLPRLYAPVLKTLVSEGHVYRLGTFGHAETGTIIDVGLDLSVFAHDLVNLMRAFALALPAALVLVAVGAWMAARRGLVPVVRLSREMESLSLGGLNQRLEVAGTDREFHPMIEAYNAMLERLDRSYRQATRFSADASHELKTPLAVMRATLEKALGQSADGSAEQTVYADPLEEADHLQSIIEALLLLSRADAGKLALTTESLDFATWLRPLMEDASMMAEERRITVHEDLGTSAVIAADAVLLYRAVHNLLRNAVAYNEGGGDIWCSTRREGDRLVFTVANTGTPIPEAERAKVFERFSRGSNAGGTGEGRGLGIGLSLAREIALAHGGSLELASHEKSRTIFELRLPVSHAADAAFCPIPAV